MKTNSLGIYLLIFYFILAVFLYFLELRQVLTPVHTVGQSISDPVRTRLVETKENVKAFFAFSKAYEREEKIFRLENENAGLLATLATHKSLEEENIHMRRLLDAGLSPSWKFSPAHVVSYIGDNFFLVSDTIPPAGTPVIVSSQLEGELTKKTGVYIGKVDQIIGNQVKIATAAEVNSKIPTIVRSKETLDKVASGILEGRGGRIVLEQVLSGETLKEGDYVFTSGESLPAELLLGEVAKVLTSTNSALQHAEVRLALDLNKIDIVFFLTKF